MTGTRVKMTGIMPSDPAPLDVGEEGTVVIHNHDVGQIIVDWDSGRKLILLESDPFEVIR